MRQLRQLQMIIVEENPNGRHWGESFLDFIKGHKNWCRAFDNVYLITTERTSKETFDIVHAILGNRLHCIIIPFEDENPIEKFNGWHRGTLWNWMRRATMPLKELYKIGYKKSDIEELFGDDELPGILAESMKREDVLKIMDKRLEQQEKEEETDKE